MTKAACICSPAQLRAGGCDCGAEARHRERAAALDARPGVKFPRKPAEPRKA